MAVSSGFFNSLNGDRKYNSEQMSDIFDGLIRGGVYASVGKVFATTPGTGLQVVVDTGRSYFNRKWVYNDAPLPLDLSRSDVLMTRIDAVVIEVDTTISVRDGNIKIITGTPSASPVKPELLHTDNFNQYAIAYITVKPQAVSIAQADITYNVGTAGCPFVTGLLEVMSIDNIVAQWAGQWTDWMNANETDYHNWFDELQAILDGNVAANIANKIIKMEQTVEVMLKADGWVGVVEPFVQTIPVPESTEDSEALLVSTLSDGANKNVQHAYTKAFGIISSGTASLGNETATFKVYKKPETDIVVGLRGLGKPFVLTDSNNGTISDSNGFAIGTSN